MQYSQKNFLRIIGNDQKNGQNFWAILEIIGKILSIIGTGLLISELLGVHFFWPPTFLQPMARCCCLECHYFLSTNDTITVAML